MEKKTPDHTERKRRGRLAPLSLPLMICHLTFGMMLSSCGDDTLTGYVPGDATIDIVANGLVFPARGDVGTVEVSTAVTATLDATWCTATVSGHVVTVTAEANSSFEGRTALLTLTAGAARRTLPVQQLGMVLGAMPVHARHAPIGGDSFTYTIPHDLPMDVSTSEPWLHASLDGDQLHVSVEANTGGHIRRGHIVTESAAISDTLTVAQYDFRSDIPGSYYIIGYLDSDGRQPAATRFDLVERNDSLFMHWSTESGRYDNTYIHVPFDAATATLTFLSAMTLYSQGSATETAYFYDSAGRICPSRYAGASCQMYYSAQTGYNAARITAYNWPGHDIYGFVIRSSSIISTTLLQLNNIAIVRVGPEGAKLE